MIDEIATIKLFGYKSTDLCKGSHKPVVTICDGCGKVMVKEMRRAKLLCKCCSMKGHIVSETTKQKIGEALTGKTHTDERRKNNSIMHGGVGGKIKRNCKRCGKTFKADNYRVKKGQGVFCSLKCSIEHQKEKSIKVKTTCDYCGKIVYRDPSKMQLKIHGTFCSSACYDDWQRENIHGENSPNWQGGLSFGNYCPKFNKKFKEYIRVKFNRQCFLCGLAESKNNGRKLSVHHVNYQKECLCPESEKGEGKEKGECQFIPLCISCHAKVHHNREKWEKFFMNKLRNNLTGWYI